MTRAEALAKAREAKKAVQVVETMAEPTATQDPAEYDFSPYVAYTEQRENDVRFVLLLNGVHKAEFHGSMDDCLKHAEAFVERGDVSKVVDVRVAY